MRHDFDVISKKKELNIGSNKTTRGTSLKKIEKRQTKKMRGVDVWSPEPENLHKATTFAYKLRPAILYSTSKSATRRMLRSRFISSFLRTDLVRLYPLSEPRRISAASTFAFPKPPVFRCFLISNHGFAMAGKSMHAFCYEGYGGGAAALKVVC